MQVVGMITTVVAALVVLLLLVVLIRSLPDIARYRRIRGM
jgi:hypothetical protein